MAYFDTTIPGTGQGYWYNFFKNSIPQVSGWDIWDDISADYHIVFRCQHPTYGTFYLELNDIADTAKLWFKVWEEWDNVNHVGNTAKGYTSELYIKRTSNCGVRLYVNSSRVIIGDRSNGYAYYAGFLQPASSYDNAYLFGAGLTSTPSTYANPLSNDLYSVWRVAKNYNNSLNVAVRVDYHYYDCTYMSLHRVTPAGYVILSPTFVVDSLTISAGKTIGIIDGATSLGEETAFTNGDTIYDDENNPWDVYVVNTSVLITAAVKKE